MCSKQIPWFVNKKTNKIREFPKQKMLLPSSDSFHHQFTSFWKCVKFYLLLTGSTTQNISLFRLHSSTRLKSYANKWRKTTTTTAAAAAIAKMKCKYWKQLHGTMGLLKAHCNVLFAFVMVVVCHYLWCDSICLANWIKRMNANNNGTYTHKNKYYMYERNCTPELWMLHMGLAKNCLSWVLKSNDVKGFYTLNVNDISHIISPFHFSSSNVVFFRFIWNVDIF